jgi:hypothetical protein
LVGWGEGVVVVRGLVVEVSGQPGSNTWDLLDMTTGEWMEVLEWSLRS